MFLIPCPTFHTYHSFLLWTSCCCASALVFSDLVIRTMVMAPASVPSPTLLTHFLIAAFRSLVISTTPPELT